MCESKGARYAGRMEQEYYLDLEAVLSIFAGRHLSGKLVADIPKGKLGKDVGYIEVVLEQGKVVSCLFAHGGTPLSGQDALNIIAGLGSISWTFSGTSMRPLPVSREQEDEVVLSQNTVIQKRTPRRTSVLTPPVLARLSRQHFRTYAYVDGQRPVEDIARLMRGTPEQVMRLLQDLEQLGLVIM